MSTHDVIVVGLGAHGSATLYQLAKRGIDVIGFDRFDPPHTMGSSHGESRGSYEAGVLGADMAEHLRPLSSRSIELWRELELETDKALFQQDGILILSHPDGTMAQVTADACERTGATYETIDGPAIHGRFPALDVAGDTLGVFQPKGGVVLLEEVIRAQLQVAARHGARIRTNEPVLSWRADGAGVEVTTPQGSYRAARVVFAVGAFLPNLVTDLPTAITAERQVITFWKPAGPREVFAPDRLPVWCYETRDHTVIFGFPDLGTGIKVGIHYPGTTTDAETVDRIVTDADVDPIRRHMEQVIPTGIGTLDRGSVCLYTCTPDLQFLVDTHPEHDNVVLACICNSEGFKYSSSFGEVLADLAIDGRTDRDLAPWSIDRLLSPS